MNRPRRKAVSYIGKERLSPISTGISAEQARSLAAEFKAPAWATHAAVRYCGTKVEPAAWTDREKGFLDEDPSRMQIGEWVGTFRLSYWHFIPIPAPQAHQGGEG
jgi:hypothetical protein